MVLTLERQICAVLLQYPDLIARAKRAKIADHDFQDQPSRSVYKAILEASELGEVTQDTVSTLIKDDPKLKSQDKALYCKVVEDLFQAEIDNTEFSFSFFAKKKAESALTKAIGDAARGLHSHEDIAKIKQELISAISKTEVAEIEVNRYEDELSARERERHEIKNGEGMMKFTGDFRHLSVYFPFGLMRETMTCIQGSTNAGKSVLLANLVKMATEPENKLNVLYVFSENRKVEALSRLDAILLGKPYEELYRSYLSKEERIEILDRDKMGYGKIYYCIPQFENFSIETVEQALIQVHESGDLIDAIFIDSPDHMIPTRRTNQIFQDKPQVWKDIKALMHKYKIGIVGTWPLREEYSGFSKSGKEPPPLVANSGAGGQDVARPMDNIIAFSYEEGADDLLAYRNVVVTKCRDGKKDHAKIKYRILNNLRFIHADDFRERYAPKDVQAPFADTET